MEAFGQGARVLEVDGHRATLRTEKSFDLLVVDYEGLRWSELSEANFLEFVQSGKGVVVLHHALLDYQSWTWWSEDVVGGRYRLQREAGDLLFDVAERVRTEHDVFKRHEAARSTSSATTTSGVRSAPG